MLVKVVSGTVWSDGAQYAPGAVIELENPERLIELKVVKPANDEDLEAATAPEIQVEIEADAEPVEYNPFSAPEPVKRGRPVKR